MTDKARLAALEAVAEAARPFRGNGNIDAALRALDALPAPTPGKMVTLAVWRGPHGNAVLAAPGTVPDRDDDRPWTRLGTVTLEVTP